MNEFRAILLGCGSSPGVPRIGGDWGACDPTEPRNRRSRSSLLVERYGKGPKPTRILIDTGPEIRNQLLDAGIDSLDAVLYSHAHADHIHGIDDLRAFWLKTKRLVDVYADDVTAARLTEAFGYCFRSPPGGSYPPILRMHGLVPLRQLEIQGDGGPIRITPFRQVHGDGHSLGFRIGGLAYSCDVNHLDDDAADQLEGLEVWIVDALRHERHPSHFSLAEALDWIGRLKPSRAVLTHMDYGLDYATLRRTLPPHVEPGYDGMAIAFAHHELHVP